MPQAVVLVACRPTVRAAALRGCSLRAAFGGRQGPLGIEFKEVSIKSCNPSGMGQFRAGRPLEAGMILRAINGVPADRLAFNA